MSSQIVELGPTCLRLRNAAPEVWDQFIAQFEAYTLNVLNELAFKDQSMVLTVQGHAQQCKALLRVFTECDQELRSKKPAAH